LASLLLALGLMLILEGLMPMVLPHLWKSLFEQMLKMEDGQIRFFGMLMVIAGMSVIWFLT
jgi:uncharacterized protein YjeT (DUF2065 family)